VTDESFLHPKKQYSGSDVTRKEIVDVVSDSQPAKYHSPILLILSCRVTSEREVHQEKQNWGSAFNVSGSVISMKK
jgi:hypothetical protein